MKITTIGQAEKAVGYWVIDKGFKGTPVPLETQEENDQFRVTMLEPYGRFAVDKKDGSVEDLNRVFPE